MANKIGTSYSAKVGREIGADYWFQKEGYGKKIDGGIGSNDYGIVGLQKTVQITSAEILALNATPKTLIAAPGAGKFIALNKATIFLDYNSAAYAGIASGEDLEIRYTDGSGQLVATIETDPFLTATADALRLVYPATTAALTPVANSPLVIRLASGEITTGDSPLIIRLDYDILPSTLGV